MNDYNEECFIPGFQIMCLTPDEEEEEYNYNIDQAEEDITWLDDCECQENLATIFSLNPEECKVDKDNHIQQLDGVHLFFEELGYLTEEPEPIDPTRDYEAEGRLLIEERNKTRKHHIDLSTPVPSLDDTNSGLSSTSSSFHQDDRQTINDIRSPLYMGGYTSPTSKCTAYNYSNHNLSNSSTTRLH